MVAKVVQKNTRATHTLMVDDRIKTGALAAVQPLRNASFDLFLFVPTI
jgi:hypothetical protein